MSYVKKSAVKPRITGLPKFIHRSPEYAELLTTEKALMIDMLDQYNGFNNGNINAALTCLKPKGWRNQKTVSKALQGLLGKRFLIITRQRVRRKCALYAFTFHIINECKGKHDFGTTANFTRHWKNVP